MPESLIIQCALVSPLTVYIGAGRFALIRSLHRALNHGVHLNRADSNERRAMNSAEDGMTNVH